MGPLPSVQYGPQPASFGGGRRKATDPSLTCPIYDGAPKRSLRDDNSKLSVDEWMVGIPELCRLFAFRAPILYFFRRYMLAAWIALATVVVLLVYEVMAISW